MAITPSADFTENLWMDNSMGSIAINAVNPLSYVAGTHTLSIANASQASSGVVTTGAQTLAGTKQFDSVPECIHLPNAPQSLCNKEYVDDMVHYSQSWQQPIEQIYDFAAGDPVGVALGKRYIAQTTTGSFIAKYIYQCITIAPVTYQEIIPTEGTALWNNLNNEALIFDSTGTWSHFGITLDHYDLMHVGTNTHAQIDTHIGTTSTDPHAGQDLRSTATPQFARIGVGVAADATKKIVTNGIIATSDTTNCSGPGTGSLQVGGAYFNGYVRNRGIYQRTIGWSSGNNNKWERVIVPYIPSVNGDRFFITLVSHQFGTSNTTMKAYISLAPSGASGNVWFPQQANPALTAYFKAFKDAVTNNIHLYFTAAGMSVGTYQIESLAGDTPTLDLAATTYGDNSADPTDLSPGSTALWTSQVTPANIVASMASMGIPIGMDQVSDVWIAAPGNDINTRSTDTVRVLNTANSTSTSTGALIVSGGSAVAKNLHVGKSIVGGSNLSSALFIASFANSIHANIAGNYLLGTAVGGATITNGKLDCTGLILRHVTYNAASIAQATNKLTVRYLYTPNYSGIPANNQAMFVISSSVGTNLNKIYLAHQASSGALFFSIYDSDGTAVYNSNLAIWNNCVEGTEYEFCLSIDLTVASNSFLFRDGVCFGNALNTYSATGRNTSVLNLFIGGFEGYLSNHFIRNFSLCSTNLFTSSTAFPANEYVVRGIDSFGITEVDAITSSGINQFTNTMASTSTTTGAIVVAGGVGVAGNLSTGSAMQVFSHDNANKFALSVANTTGLTTFAKSTAGSTPDFAFSGDATTGIVNVNCSKNATSSTTGALVVAGGVGVAGNISTAGSLQVFSPDNANKFALSVANTTGLTTFAKSTAGTTPDFVFTGDATTGIVNVNCSKNATSSTTGAIVVAGGVGIAQDACIGGAVQLTDTTASAVGIDNDGGSMKFTIGDDNMYYQFSPVPGKAATSGMIMSQCSMEATAANSASVMLSGGLGCNKRVWAKNMTCENAPSADTDVLRKYELDNFTASHTLEGAFEGQGQEPSISCDLYYVKIGNVVTLSSNSLITITPNENEMFSYSLTLGDGYKPASPIWHFVSYEIATIKHMAVVNVTSNGQIVLGAFDAAGGMINFTSGVEFKLHPFSFTFYA